MGPLDLGRIAAAIGARPLSPELAAQSVAGISLDSRQIRPGELFWALTGERFDGHQFVPHALATGAVGAVVREDYGNAGPLLRVADTRQALGWLAAANRRACRATVIAVTGSVGKTSAREAIWAVLRRRMCGVRSPKNFNNDIGVPVSLLALDLTHEFAVIELGGSRPGEITSLAAMAEPQVAVVTAIGEAHLEGFGSMESVTAAKEELIQALDPSGIAILNADDPRVRAIGRRAARRVLWYGTQTRRCPTDVLGYAVAPGTGTISFRFGDGTPVRLMAAGRHQVYAALAAIAVGRWCGMQDGEIAEGLEDYQTPPMRCEVQRLGHITLINDAYNANPMSMRAALGLLCDWPTEGHRVLVCGDMIELGASALSLHRALGREIANCEKVDQCLAVGPLSRAVVEAALEAGMNKSAIRHCSSAEEAAWWLSRMLSPGDVALVKASRGMRLEKTIALLDANFRTQPGASQGLPG